MTDQHHPPKWVQKIFQWYCPSILHDEIEGDMLEVYQQMLKENGLLKANLNYIFNVILFFNPTTYRKARQLNNDIQNTSNLTAMIQHYFLMIWRNFRKQPGFSLLNLAGLTAGITATLLILLYIHFEINYDRHHQHAERIYRVNTATINTHSKDIDVSWINTPGNLGPYIVKDYPEVEEFVRFYQFYQGDGIKMNMGSKELVVNDVYAVDETVFDIFSFDLINGDPVSALSQPNSIVISQQLARQLFGYEDPIGKTIQTGQMHSTLSSDLALDLKVTGVFRDWPKNVHLPVEGMISVSSDPEIDNYYFNRFGFYTFVLLHPDVNPDVLGAKFTDIYLNYLDTTRDPVLKSAIHELLPLTQIHLSSTGGMIYIYIFGAVAILLMLIAIISYINMVTAQASKRVVEIGLRKVLGSHRLQLCSQIFTESLFFATTAFVAAFILVWLIGQRINDLLSLNLDIAQLWQPEMLLIMLGMVLIIGLMGGSYPAIFLSSFKPISALKGNVLKGALLRRWLVAIQFAVVIFVLVSTGMIYEQLKFAKEKDLGFHQDQVLSVTLANQEQQEKWAVLKEELAKSPFITATASSTFIPGRYGLIRGPFSANGTMGPEPQFVRFGEFDYDYLSTINVGLIEGRNFSRAFSADLENSIIVNQAFVKSFGLTSPIGAQIRRGDQGNPNFLTIVGVIEDFHHGSLHEPIESQLFFLGSASQVLINVDKDVEAGIQHLKSTWGNMFPDDPFEFNFLADEIQRGYEVDRIRGKIFFSFSLITIFIAFLGLFGLAAYLAKQRIKEIGIRKVLGCSNWSVVSLITKDFIKMILVAAVPALIAAWYMIDNWLSNFAFQTDMNYLLFLMVIVITIVITLVTTGFHALVAARINPAISLKE